MAKSINPMDVAAVISMYYACRPNRRLTQMGHENNPIKPPIEKAVDNETFFGDAQYASSYFARLLPPAANLLVGAHVAQVQREGELQGLSGDFKHLHLSDDSVSHRTFKVLDLTLLK